MYMVYQPPFSAKFKRLHPQAILPRLDHPGDAGLGLYSVESHDLAPGARAAIGIGWAVDFPHGYVARILGRSGLAVRVGLHPIGGVIDASYRGEWKVILLNSGHEPYHVEKGEKIAQVVFYPIITPVIEEVTDLSDSTRGTGGFGSTGRK